jgi:hypothetical protein
LEFRHHQGTVNRDEILNWAAICDTIIAFGLAKTEKWLKKEWDGKLKSMLASKPELWDYYQARVALFADNE